MKVDVTVAGPGTLVVAPQGDVDMSSSPEVRRLLAPLFGGGVRRIVVDLSMVPYMDSSGIATLIEGLQLSQRSSVRFSLAGMHPAVQAVFELAHLQDVFQLFPDVATALAEGTQA
jgi:anti-sigma B factor antagonist